MTLQTIWYFTDIPEDIVTSIEKDLIEKFDDNMADSRLSGDAVNKDKRNSENAWVPSSHWIGGFIWHYVQRANRENFLYDISNIDAEAIQYTKYSVGNFYTWHNDAGLQNTYKPKSTGSHSVQDFLNLNVESVRKLSFVLQLSNPNDYEGGNLQLIDEEGKSYFAPRKRGSIIIFDSRTQHRVLKVTKGERKSVVGWVVGPRWK